MNLYIDCEWNSYKGELISMALVDEDGNYFYKSLGCFKPDPWVAEHVIPVLNKISTTKEDMQNALESFLGQWQHVNIIADWPEDIQYFCEFLITGPGTAIVTPAMTMEIIRGPDVISKIPHNALEDARANRLHFMGIEV